MAAHGSRGLACGAGGAALLLLASASGIQKRGMVGIAVAGCLMFGRRVEGGATGNEMTWDNLLYEFGGNAECGGGCRLVG